MHFNSQIMFSNVCKLNAELKAIDRSFFLHFQMKQNWYHLSRFTGDAKWNCEIIKNKLFRKKKRTCNFVSKNVFITACFQLGMNRAETTYMRMNNFIARYLCSRSLRRLREKKWACTIFSF